MIAALPRPVQRQAQARALTAALLNPLGASITFGQVLYLLALHYGASDGTMALLYASLNITGLLALFGPWLLAGQDTSTVQSRAWLVRGLMSLALLGLPLLASDTIKVAVLVAVVYVMMAARTVGVLANAAVHKAICPERELASFFARIWTRWHAGVLATTVLCAGVLHFQDRFPSTEVAFMVLMAIGVVFNIATAVVMSGLPPTGTVTAASPLQTVAGFAAAWRQPEQREMLWLTLLQMPIGLAAAFQLNYLTHVQGMSASTVFLLTLGGVLASILATRVLGVVGGRISNRALWFGMHAVLAVVAVGWCAIGLVPEAGRSAACAVLWVLAAMALAGSSAIYGSMLSERLPGTDATRISVVYQVTGVMATLLGLGALALVHEACAASGWAIVHPYTHAFVLWAMLSLGVCAISLRLGRGSAATDLLAQLTPGNLSTIFRAHQLRTVERDVRPGSIIEREELMAAGTPAGRELVLETMRSPDPWLRLAALRAVRAAPFPAVLPLVQAEVEDAESPLRVEATTTLGFIGGAAALPILHRLLSEADTWLRAAAMKSLSRLGEPPPVAEMLGAYAQSGTRERSELLIALAVAGRHAELRSLLADAMRQGAGASWQDSIALAAAQAIGGRDALRTILAAESEAAGVGLDEAIALLAERDPSAAEAAQHAVAIGDWAALDENLPVVNSRQAAIAVALRAVALPV